MTDGKIYYFDNNATTRVAPEVIEAMTPFLAEYWGNPSSAYIFGSQVGKKVEHARESVAALINADPREVIFTSCGTESNNSAIHSAMITHPGKRHILTTAVEHSANIKFCGYLEKRGYEVTFLPVESDGSIDLLRLLGHDVNRRVCARWNAAECHRYRRSCGENECLLHLTFPPW